jgi:hypothetical protein
MLTDFQFNAQRMWRLCLKCAWALDHPQNYESAIGWRCLLIPNDDPMTTYMRNTAQLLLGTAAQESAFEWERQRSPAWDGTVGGFSKWQLETASMKATLDSLRINTIRLTKVTQFLFADPKATTAWLNLPFDTFLWMLRLNDNDYLGVMFAREHYRRIAAPIPKTLQDQAKYWKHWYNSELGAGTPEQYLKSWQIYCADAVANPA